MKFEDVKVGDIVYLEKEIVYGYSRSKLFIVKDEVVRVTKTQFVTKTNRRYRKGGAEVGKFMSVAYKEGDVINRYPRGQIVTDQTQEVAAFIKKINLEKHINKTAESISIKLNSKLTVEELNSVLDKLNEIEQLIEKQ